MLSLKLGKKWKTRKEERPTDWHCLRNCARRLVPETGLPNSLKEKHQYYFDLKDVKFTLIDRNADGYQHLADICYRGHAFTFSSRPSPSSHIQKSFETFPVSLKKTNSTWLPQMFAQLQTGGSGRVEH